MSLDQNVSILAIQHNCKNQIKFAFEEMELASIEKKKKIIT